MKKYMIAAKEVDRRCLEELVGTAASSFFPFCRDSEVSAVSEAAAIADVFLLYGIDPAAVLHIHEVMARTYILREDCRAAGS